MTLYLIITGLAAVIGGAWYLVARRNFAHLAAILPAVRAYALRHGHRLAEPGAWWFHGGFDQSWPAVSGESSGLPFKLEYCWSRTAGRRYLMLEAAPVWLPNGGFDISRHRRAGSQWQEAGLWIAAGPESVAAALRGPLKPAIGQLAALPAFEGANAMNVEVSGAKKLTCWIKYNQWVSDAGELDRLVALLITLCKGR